MGGVDLLAAQSSLTHIANTPAYESLRKSLVCPQWSFNG